MNGFQNRGSFWGEGIGKRGYLWGVLMRRVRKEFWEAGSLLNLGLSDGYMGILYEIHPAAHLSLLHIYRKYINYNSIES